MRCDLRIITVLAFAICCTEFQTARSTGTEENCIYRKVTASKSVIAYSGGLRKYEVLDTSSLASPVAACSNKCCSREWCKLWCLNLDNTCHLSNIIITPGYQETQSDALSCYTTPTRNVIGRGTTFNYTIFDIHAQRTGRNIVNGIFDYKGLDGCLLTNSAFPHFLIDLGDRFQFSNIKFVAQKGGFANKLQDLTVRIGTSQISFPDDLKLYRPFGFFPGPAEQCEEILLTSQAPVTARFISFQKPVETSFLQICHIQVY